MTRRPCCPSRISFRNVNIANQKTGVMSTPKAGGTTPFTSRSNGSVGHATKTHGTALRFVSGYQDATTRHSIANDIKFRKGPRTKAVGCTQASVSASVKPDDATVEDRAWVVSVIEVTSISRGADEYRGHGVKMVWEAGLTKAAAPFTSSSSASEALRIEIMSCSMAEFSINMQSNL